MNNIETEVLELLLAGEHPDLAILRVQLATAKVKNREYTGVGFFTDFEIAEGIPKLNSERIIIGDVYADITGLEHGAGFLLFVNSGIIHTLECCIVEDKWPESAKIKRAYYMRPKQVGDATLTETTKRDLNFAFKSQNA